MRARLEQMMGGSLPPGFGAGPAAPEQPKLGQVCKISSNAHLQGIIHTTPGVIIDFWSPSCPPCMRFKPTYEAAARANQNENIVFCAVQTNEVQDAAMEFQVSSIPQFNFMLNG